MIALKIFFDTSAVVPLVVEEAHTFKAREVWSRCGEAWAWEWLLLEAEAALSRRKADARSWQNLRTLSGQFRLVSLSPAQFDALRAFNRPLALRAADAAHLFVCERLLGSVPELRLITFDREQAAASARLSLPLYRRGG